MNKHEKIQIKKQELQKQKEKYFNKLLEIMEKKENKCKNIRSP
jgi:hypothetical protein